MLTLLLLASAQPADALPMPPQRALYVAIFEDVGRITQLGQAETGISPYWTTGYDVTIDRLGCTPGPRILTCRFSLTRRPDGTPLARNAGRSLAPLGCRAELERVATPGGSSWRVRRWPGPAGTAGRSTMRCGRDRTG